MESHKVSFPSPFLVRTFRHLSALGATLLVMPTILILGFSRFFQWQWTCAKFGTPPPKKKKTGKIEAFVRVPVCYAMPDTKPDETFSYHQKVPPASKKATSRCTCTSKWKGWSWKKEPWVCPGPGLGGGFRQTWIFWPYLARWSKFDQYFSGGLVQPPAIYFFIWKLLVLWNSGVPCLLLVSCESSSSDHSLKTPRKTYLKLKDGSWFRNIFTYIIPISCGRSTF